MNKLILTFSVATCAVARRTAVVFATGAVAACMISLAPSSALAQQLKIGYVDFERVMLLSLPARAMEDKLAAEILPRQRQLDELGAHLKAVADQLDKEGPTLSEHDIGRRRRELIDQERDLMRKLREFNEEVAQRRNEQKSELWELTHRAIRQIFKQEKYDLILQDAVMAAPTVDITNEVMKALATAAPAAQ
ncbi:OmpH family outer membrane protein [Acidovorax sp. LjRoot118]|uniref:OmpH family outer membrane protein n=1 Tax=unclassified Acidovorax TaxID=2684926 RepID=UPI000AC75334|nr:OmpH family outer membrane protein [Acidovorax sp. Root217]